MSKWFGKIGYAITTETKPGYWDSQIIEKTYRGEMKVNRWNRQNANTINDNIGLSNIISIIADPFAFEHCSKIAYVEYMGTKWRATVCEIAYPRITLTLGGEWNEDMGGSP